MALLISDIIFGVCIVLACSYLFHVVSRKTSNLPPGPVGWPLVGSLLQLHGLPNEALARLSKQYGPLMSVWLGCKATVVVSSAEMAEEVMHRQNHVFSGKISLDAATAFGYDQHSFVLSQVGPRWRALRRMSNNEMFTPRRLDAMKGLREEKVGALIQHIREAAADGRAVDIGECAFSITQNLLACTLFSQDIADLSSELTPGGFKSLVYEMLEIFSKPNLCDFFPALRWIDPQGLRRRNGNALTRLYVILDQLIDEHLRAYEAAAAKGEAKKKEDFLDVLLELTRDPNSGFTRENIRPLLSDMFIAGSESSATTIEWAMTELLRHPDKMAAAQSELKQAIGAGSFVKESDIMHLPYLMAVMKETLRLHTPGPVVPRRADATTTLGGFTIPKHTPILINVWAINNDDTLWDKPTAFLPERFIESDVNFNGKHFQFMPFGAGKRICPGIPLASRTVLLVLASLINSFSWTPSNQVAPEELDVKAKFRLVLQKAAPLKAFPSPLKDM
ncbi:geraniol 8-hydroxylase-like [Nymphaea colorata]|nr:geraniol 8-hydroxylase-like [Nymphaea colorata]